MTDSLFPIRSSALVAATALLLVSCGGANVDVEFAEVTGSIAPVTSVPGDVDRVSQITEVVSVLVADEAVPSIAWATVSNGSITAGASGLADQEAARDALSTTAYALGSVSKPVLSAVVMTLVEAGLLDLDTDVNAYLSDVRIDNPFIDDEVITLRSLMTHTSGIIDNDEAYRSQYRFDGDEHMALADFMAAYFQPGGELYDPIQNFAPDDSYAYSNVGAGLVGFVVEQITGDPLVDVAAERLFDPLAMTDTGWRLGSFSDVDRVATPYTASLSGVEAIGHVGYATYPDGGLRSSAADMARFVGMIVGGGSFDGVDVLQPASVEVLIDQRLFWEEQGRFSGHDGSDPGAMAEIIVDPSNGFGAVMMTNTDTAAGSEALGITRTELIVANGYDLDEADSEGVELTSQLTAFTGGLPGDVAVASVINGVVAEAATGDLSASSLLPLPGVTSAMLGVVFSQLADEGVLLIDQPVTDFVDDDIVAGVLAGSDAPITVAQLLDHSAGLGLPVATLGTGASVDDLLRSVSPGRGQPGAFSLTHNLVAIKVLESVTREPAADVFVERIFEPAEMSDAVLVMAAGDGDAVVEGTLSGAADEPVSTREFGDGVSLTGSVALSPSDVVSFVEALYAGRLFDTGSDALERMSPLAGSDQWGLGVLDLTEFAGSPTSGMLGDLAGYRSFVAWTLDGDAIVAVLSNSEFIDLEELVDSVVG
ncbi:MAG: serine hydrolase domain-containing protein [Ilumatobacter sp.]